MKKVFIKPQNFTSHGRCCPWTSPPGQALGPRLTVKTQQGLTAGQCWGSAAPQGTLSCLQTAPQKQVRRRGIPQRQPVTTGDRDTCTVGPPLGQVGGWTGQMGSGEESPAGAVRRLLPAERRPRQVRPGESPRDPTPLATSIKSRGKYKGLAF